jgi:hypothetical protein
MMSILSWISSVLLVVLAAAASWLYTVSTNAALSARGRTVSWTDEIFLFPAAVALVAFFIMFTLKRDRLIFYAFGALVMLPYLYSFLLATGYFLWVGAFSQDIFLFVILPALLGLFIFVGQVMFLQLKWKMRHHG